MTPNMRAFTLVEMMVCVVLIGLLAALAVVSLGGTHRAARTADVVAEVLLRDRLARETAERFDHRLELRFDLTAGTVATAEPDQVSGLPQRRPYALPYRWRLGEVATATGTRATSGMVAVPCSAGGRSPSYEFVLIDPLGKQTCTLVVGPTGQSMEVPDANRARQALAMLLAQKQGHDAD